MLRASGVSDRGRVRPTNEDCFAIHEDLGLCVIADGMGGHNAGEVAARMAVDAVVDHVRRAADAAPRVRTDQTSLHPFGVDPALSPAGNLLRSAILLANIQILEAATLAERFVGMGTTIVAAHAAAGRLTVGHVGDSRLYLLTERALRQLTRDDSWTATMLAQDPSADPALLQNHPMRHVLTNVVGTRARTDVHVVENTLNPRDLFVLTTDGVHGVVEDRVLAQLVGQGDDPLHMAEEIVAAALARGTRDNCTAVVARYDG